MKIRKANKRDLKNIINLSEEWVKEAISLSAESEKSGELRKELKEGLVFVAVKQNKIIGYITGKVMKSQINIKVYGIKRGQKYTKLLTLYVLKKFRNKDIGKRLVGFFLKMCKNKPKPIVLHADNTKLVNFYKKFNFKICYIAMKK